MMTEWARMGSIGEVNMLNVVLVITLLVFLAVHLLATRLTVRALGRGADNGWDNAAGYLIVSGGLLFASRWVWEGPAWLLVTVLPLFGSAALVYALKVIYQVSVRRAGALCALHLALTSLMMLTYGVLFGSLAALLLYGRIIADPIWLLRLALRLIGIELPF